MRRPRLPRVLALLAPLALLLPACTVEGLDELASGGNDDDDEDEDQDDDETEGDEDSDTEGDDDPKPSIESGDEPSESDSESASNSNSESASATEGGEESSGGWDPSGSTGSYPETSGDLPGDDACVSYCNVELACDAYYPSVEECVQACAEQSAGAGACADSFAGMNLCLGSLGCEDFDAFWAALAALQNGEEVGSFPCDVALLEFVQCAEGGAGAGA
jgi:hypothetical protein